MDVTTGCQWSRCGHALLGAIHLFSSKSIINYDDSDHNVYGISSGAATLHSEFPFFGGFSTAIWLGAAPDGSTYRVSVTTFVVVVNNLKTDFVAFYGCIFLSVFLFFFNLSSGHNDLADWQPAKWVSHRRHSRLYSSSCPSPSPGPCSCSCLLSLLRCWPVRAAVKFLIFYGPVRSGSDPCPESTVHRLVTTISSPLLLRSWSSSKPPPCSSDICIWQAHFVLVAWVTIPSATLIYSRMSSKCGPHTQYEKTSLSLSSLFHSHKDTRCRTRK